MQWIVEMPGRFREIQILVLIDGVRTVIADPGHHCGNACRGIAEQRSGEIRIVCRCAQFVCRRNNGCNAGRRTDGWLPSVGVISAGKGIEIACAAVGWHGRVRKQTLQRRTGAAGTDVVAVDRCAPEVRSAEAYIAGGCVDQRVIVLGENGAEWHRALGRRTAGSRRWIVIHVLVRAGAVFFDVAAPARPLIGREQ